MKGKTMEPSERVNDYDKKKADDKAKLVIQIKQLFRSIHAGMQAIDNNHDDGLTIAASDFHDAAEAISEVE